MAYIYHISRTLLQQKVKKFGHYMEGCVLDAGSGSYSRYKHFFSCKSIVCLDVVESSNVHVVGSVDKMPFKNNEFDSIFSIQVLEHVEYPEKAVSEMSRVLKTGGHVLITVPQWNELHEEPHDYWRYTCFGLISLFKRNGFSVIAHEQIGGFYCTRAQMSMRYFIDRFDIYHRFWRRPASFLFRLWGEYSIWLDKRDTSIANRKHTIGWVFVFKKLN